jgi:hypothetical protein
MELIRFALGTVVMGGLCIHLLSEIALGLRNRKMRYGRGRGEHFAKRSTQPLLFWLLVFVFAMFTLASAGFVAWLARATLFR